MRKWTIPLTCIGLGGLGAVLFSQRGRRLRYASFSREDHGRMVAWDDSARSELSRIQKAVRELERSFQKADIS